MNTRKNFVIGIDAGVKTGVAIFNRERLRKEYMDETIEHIEKHLLVVENSLECLCSYGYITRCDALDILLANFQEALRSAQEINAEIKSGEKIVLTAEELEAKCREYHNERATNNAEMDSFHDR